MPSDDMFEVNGVTLKKAITANKNQYKDEILTDFSFQFSQDGGSNWVDYLDGKWIPTGQMTTDDLETETQIKIEPPMLGNAFRIVFDKEHKMGKATHGRFDFWIEKIYNNSLPSEEKEYETEGNPKGALTELGAKFTPKNSYSAAWNQPKLNSPKGWWMKPGTENQENWW